MSATHKTTPTPNPAERSLVVTVTEDSFASAGGKIPPQGTLYSDPAWKTFFGGDYKKNFSEFVYTGQVGEFGLAFAMGKTLDQANTPFRTYKEFKDHHWPKVLLALAIVQDYTYPNVTNVISGSDAGIVTAPMNYGKYALVDDVDEGTIFVTEEFFGPIPYAIPRYPVPVTSPVHVEVLGVTYDFANCLHPKIAVQNTRTGSAQLVAGSASATGGALNGQLFPATNFETWAPYVLTDQQEYRDNGWYRIRVRVFPPDLPDTSIGNT